MVEPRPRRFNMALTEQEAETLEKLAKSDGCDKADVLRRLLNREGRSLALAQERAKRPYNKGEGKNE